MAGPCNGLVVLDFSWGMAGGLATTVLADFGSDVIKIEPPAGDPFRSHPAWLAWNRGKKSAVLDLKTAEGRMQAQRLAEQADVVLESFHRGEVRPDGEFRGPNESRGARLRRRAGRYLGSKSGSSARYFSSAARARCERSRPMGPDQHSSEYDSLRLGGSHDAPPFPPGPEDLSARLLGSAATTPDAAIYPGEDQRRALVAAR